MFSLKLCANPDWIEVNTSVLSVYPHRVPLFASIKCFAIQISGATVSKPAMELPVHKAMCHISALLFTYFFYHVGWCERKLTDLYFAFMAPGLFEVGFKSFLIFLFPESFF